MLRLVILAILLAMVSADCGGSDRPTEPTTGACCASAGTCAVTTQAACTGSWTLAGVCTPNPCAQPTGSCCASDGTCTVTLRAACTGSWTEAGVCTPNPCARMALIPAGTFTMGSPIGEPGRWGWEAQHQVTLTHGFYMQTTEVTKQQYVELAQWAYDQGHATVKDDSLCDNLDGSTQKLARLDWDVTFYDGIFRCQGPEWPVSDVTWYGAVAYCDWLSLRQGLPRAYNHITWKCNGGSPYATTGYRLPTEAEWEYACRAGSTTAFPSGPITQVGYDPIDPNLDQIGWYRGNSGQSKHPVASKLSNAWGLYDMHGNAVEWCHDGWSGLGTDPVTDPDTQTAYSSRVIRGGFYGDNAAECRSSARGWAHQDLWGCARGLIGFRVVRSSH